MRLFSRTITGQGEKHIPDTPIFNTDAGLRVVAPEPARSCGSKKPRWSDSFCRNDYISDAGSVAGCLGIAVSQTCRSLDIRRNSKAHSHRFLAGAAHNRRNRSWRQGFWCHNVRMFSGLCSFQHLLPEPCNQRSLSQAIVFNTLESVGMIWVQLPGQ